MNDASRFAKDRLQEASRARRGARLLAITLGTLALALLVLLAVALLDYWFMLVPSVRMAGLAVLGLFVAGGIYSLVRLMRQPARLKDAALDAEAVRPEIGCEISTAAEYLGGERQPKQEYEADLAGALQENAAQHLRKIEVPYWHKPLRRALLVMVLLLGVLFFGVLASGGFTAFQRAVLPWSDTTYTQVEVMPGDVEIPVGTDLEIRGVFRGRAPREATFHWLEEGSAQWRLAALTRSETGAFIYPLKEVRTPLKYRVSGSDAISRDFSVLPYIPPEVKDWKVALAWPAYTGRGKTEQRSPEISVVRGTVATIEIAPTVQLSRARLLFKEGPPLDLSRQPSGLWTAGFTINKDAEFSVELADAKGRPNLNVETHRIIALPDEAPKVDIVEPGHDIAARATNSVPIKIRAADDFGIQELRLVYHRLGGPEQIITFQSTGGTNAEFSAEIPLSKLGLQEYELVAYHAEAVDNNTLDGPGLGRSETYFIEITNEEGAECKSQGQGQKVNLLVIQKQIIADTAALARDAASEKFAALGQRQKDAGEFGWMYQQALMQGGAPAEVVREMAAAIADMDEARNALEARSAATALPREESALARLYQVIKMMPELENLPTIPPAQQQQLQEAPPALQVVLEEIKKKKEEQAGSQELAQALDEAKRLQEEQASLTIGKHGSASGSPNNGNGQTQMDRSASEKNGRQMTAQKGESKNGAGNEAEAQAAIKEDAPKQEQLGKEARELAERLARLAGKDSRLGHGAKKMSDAAAKMGAAAEAMAQGNSEMAGTHGAQAGVALNSAIAMLERLLHGRPERVDVSKEDAPKQYEAAIAEYFKTLSYDE